MESSGARSAMAHLISNFSLDDEVDLLDYEEVAKGLTTTAYIADMRSLAAQAEPLGTFSRATLETMYEECFQNLVHARIEAAEFKTLLLALDLKLSNFARFVEEKFARCDGSLKEQLRSVMAKFRITPHHRLCRAWEQNQRKTRLRLVKK